MRINKSRDIFPVPIRKKKLGRPAGSQPNHLDHIPILQIRVPNFRLVVHLITIDTQPRILPFRALFPLTLPRAAGVSACKHLLILRPIGQPRLLQERTQYGTTFGRGSNGEGDVFVSGLR